MGLFPPPADVDVRLWAEGGRTLPVDEREALLRGLEQRCCQSP